MPAVLQFIAPQFIAPQLVTQEDTSQVQFQVQFQCKTPSLYDPNYAPLLLPPPPPPPSSLYDPNYAPPPPPPCDQSGIIDFGDVDQFLEFESDQNGQKRSREEDSDDIGQPDDKRPYYGDENWHMPPSM
jgi:hypothetical protein